MKKSELAKQLRDRHYLAKIISRKTIDAIDDTGIIESYITCSCCGERFITDVEFIQALNQARDAEHFLDLVDMFSELKAEEMKN